MEKVTSLLVCICHSLSICIKYQILIFLFTLTRNNIKLHRKQYSKEPYGFSIGVDFSLVFLKCNDTLHFLKVVFLVTSRKRYEFIWRYWLSMISWEDVVKMASKLMLKYWSGSNFQTTVKKHFTHIVKSMESCWRNCIVLWYHHRILDRNAHSTINNWDVCAHSTCSCVVHKSVLTAP